MGTDTPAYAAFELLLYGLVYLFCYVNRNEFGYSEKELMNVREVSLRVLAPREYFEINNLSWLEKGLDEGVREFALSLINNDIRMSFDFVAFPAEFDVPFSTGAELSAV